MESGLNWVAPGEMCLNELGFGGLKRVRCLIELDLLIEYCPDL